MHLSIIIPEGDFILSSVVGTYKVFNTANRYLERIGKEPFYHIDLVGINSSTSLYGGRFSVHPDAWLPNTPKTDLILIPALHERCLDANSAFVPWIKEQHAQGAEVASLCTGAFLLAQTGLLNNKRCSTHWMAAPLFRKMFPEVNLSAEKVIVDESGIYSSGGAFSFLNLVLYLVEKHLGREVAVYLSKVMEIDLDRNSQSPFLIFQGQKDHDDEPIKKAQDYIETRLDEKISVDQLATLFSISRRNFERRFRKATSNSPAEYLQRVKMEAAKKALEHSNSNVNEVMYAVGYSDGKAFRTLFKKYTGVSPLEYKKRYNRHLVDLQAIA